MSMGDGESSPASRRAARAASATMSRTEASSRKPTKGVMPTPATSAASSAEGVMRRGREPAGRPVNREIETYPAK